MNKCPMVSVSLSTLDCLLRIAGQTTGKLMLKDGATIPLDKVSLKWRSQACDEAGHAYSEVFITLTPEEQQKQRERQ